jgi:hypothetical protein
MFGKNRLFVLLRHGATQTGKSCRKGKNKFLKNKFYLVFYLKNFFTSLKNKLTAAVCVLTSDTNPPNEDVVNNGNGQFSTNIQQFVTYW